MLFEIILKELKKVNKLLRTSKPLSELKAKPTGLPPELTIQRRQSYLNMINEMDEAKLKWHLQHVEFQIERRLSDPLVGTSELEW